jgi:RNA polymerase sigma factor (sigma-70 family)
MNETDFNCLQRFAHAGDQGAFREMVRRHINLVFATALRKTGDAGGAEEISQNVFGALARKAWRFAPDDSLPAWLYKTTLLESKSWLRGELRRRRREETAAELGTTMKNLDEQPAFNALVPLLDEALLSLREKDRVVLLLRYYEKQSLREVGGALGVSEDTAQKRVQTALENLSQFFQRRGFKTATASAAVAALQGTSTSVSAATAAAVAGAALKTAPPALAGVSAWFARLASLSKAQTAAVCLVLTAGPVLWQWNEVHQAAVALADARTKLAASEDDFTQLQTETDQLRVQSSRLDDSLAAATRSATDQYEQNRQFEAWKKRMRSQLLAADYQWSDDSPFVRIPKKIVPKLSVKYPVQPPGVLKQEASELLGLSPQERTQAETALQSYYSTMNNLMQAGLSVTNIAYQAYIPNNSAASQVYDLSALGASAKESGDQLLAALQTTLGDERWQFVQDELQTSGTDSLRGLLNLDADSKGQELAVWIMQQNGNYYAGMGWSQAGSSFSSAGINLKYFLPGAQFPAGNGPMDFEQLSPVLTGPAMAWFQQQAQSLVGTKGSL